MHWSGLNSDLKPLLKRTVYSGGVNLSKIKVTNKRKTLKNG